MTIIRTALAYLAARRVVRRAERLVTAIEDATARGVNVDAEAAELRRIVGEAKAAIERAGAR